MGAKSTETGVIEGVNDNGIKVNGRWLNFSKFYKGTRTPAKGSNVKMVVDEFNGKDYVNELTVLGGGAQQSMSGSSYNAGSNRDASIERQVAFKGAIELAVANVIRVDEISKYTDQFDELIKVGLVSTEEAA